MEQARPDGGLERLDVLVGEWTMAAGPAGAPVWPGDAVVTFEWLAPRAFLVERWAVSSGFDGIAIIGPGEGGSFRRHYFDARGEHRVYEMTLGDGVWKQWRHATNPFPQRFHAEISDDGETIAGRWEKLAESGRVGA